MSEIKTILCHAGDEAAALLLKLLASNESSGSIRRQVLSHETIKDGDKPLYYHQVISLWYAGTEKTVCADVVTLLPNSISKATFLQRAQLKYSEVFYVTVMSNHGEWLELEPSAVDKTYILIEPKNRYSRISGFHVALVLNDLRRTSVEDPSLLNAVNNSVKVVAEHVLGPKPKTKKRKIQPDSSMEVQKCRT
jgi:hypothetical protein